MKRSTGKSPFWLRRQHSPMKSSWSNEAAETFGFFGLALFAAHATSLFSGSDSLMLFAYPLGWVMLIIVQVACGFNERRANNDAKEKNRRLR